MIVSMPTAAGADPEPIENGRIAFNEVYFHRRSVAIFTVRPDGGGLRQVTNALRGVVTAVPDWSPDGRWIAYQRGLWGSDRFHIFVMRANGTHRTDLSRGPCARATCTSEGHPAWSPDGAQIAFSRYDEGGSSIYLMRAGGTQRHRVTTAPKGREDEGPNWSPDGSRLVFGRYSGARDRSAVFIVRVDGKHLRQITPWALDAGHPEWSPDGRWILFDNHIHTSGAQVCLIRQNGSHFHEITHTPDFVWYRPTFSPDGTMVAAIGWPGVSGENDVFVMRLDDTRPIAVTAPLSDRRSEGALDWGIRR
jgi:TolB protein